MRAWVIEGGFGEHNLRCIERPDPTAGPGQVVIRVRAVSLNYRDLLVVRGLYAPRQPLPLVPCSDAVGEVVATGEGVRRVAVGDRVCPIFAQRWLSGPVTPEGLRSTLGSPHDGVLSELVVLSEEGVVLAPVHLSDAEAATLPCAGVTAWHALFEEAPVRAGDTVLVLGTGGVSTFALQLATAAGARVVVTSSSHAKLARAAELGAVHGICYADDPKWGDSVRRWTGGRGVDHVIEVGGVGTLAQSLRAVRPGGTVSLIGVLAGGREPLDLTSALMRNVRIQGVFVGSREMFDALGRAVTAAALQPVVDRVVPFDRAPAAWERLAAGEHLGKIVIAGAV